MSIYICTVQNKIRGADWRVQFSLMWRTCADWLVKGREGGNIRGDWLVAFMGDTSECFIPVVVDSDGISYHCFVLFSAIKG